jgi:cytochrome c551/c552
VRSNPAPKTAALYNETDLKEGKIIRGTVFVLCAIAAPLFAQSGAPAAQALTQQYCVACHSAKAKTAGIVLEGIDWSNPAANSATLEKVLRKVRTGEMPPAKLPHPAPAAATAFTTWLEAELDKSAAAHPNPGRPAIHRLNRAEYGNAVRDLLGIQIDATSLLPVDDSGYGFDNVADVLSVSPALLERYMTVARLVSRRAVGQLNLKPGEDEYEAPRTGGRGRAERISDALPFDSAGGVAIHHYFPVDAEYLIKVKMAGGGAEKEVRLPVKAGDRLLGVTFLHDSSKPELAAPINPRAPAAAGGGRGQQGPPPPPAKLDIRLDGARLKLFDVGANSRVDKVLIAGPYNPTGRGDTVSREKIFVCHPATASEEDGCAHTILAKLAHRAFRRPVTDSDLKPLLAFYRSGRVQGDFDLGIEKALRAMLVSPNFIFRVERDPAGAKPGSVSRINDVELASRLSFFLWSSIPDDTLLEIAEKGHLHEPAILNREVRRMLDDPRSDALVSNFAGQWLYLRNLEVAKPDPDAFPEFDSELKDAFRKETELFFANILREDHSVLELLDAKYTYLNQRLAEHYGIPNVYGSQFRQVALTDPNRGGILGQGSILTVTSYPNRTSVVQRGKWILETLLGAPPPPPPPDVPDLKAHGADGRQLTMREQMEMHRANPVCASCHSRMDPLGFALENYDGVGKWRAKDAGNVIDPSGKLPDGTVFEGPAGLKKILLTRDKDAFVNTVTQKMMTYALGRGLESYDMPAVRAAAREAAKNDYRISALIAAVVNSTPFQMRRTSEQ